jgi:D-arabinose 1-dehydrogenase-like Zn-dependent alcohol dehydrogenase
MQTCIDELLCFSFSDREFAAMLEFVDRHKIVPVIDRTYRLEDVVLALDRMRTGAQFGKLVLDISAPDSSPPLASKL